jgi:flagellar hook-associated protein 2
MSEDVMETDYLQALGAGAGFDTKKIVSALVTAEKASKQSAIDRRTSDVEASVSGMAMLKSSLQTLQTAVQKIDDQNDFNFSSFTNSAPAAVMASFDSNISLPGTYKVNVSQLAQNDVYQTVAASDGLEVDTYTLSAAVSAGGTATLTYEGITYTKAFDTDAATTMSGLVAAINAGSAGSTVTAATTSATTFTMTKNTGSDVQMTQGTIGGTTDGSVALTGAAENTTVGVDAVTADKNGISAATVVIQVGSGAAETVTLAAGATSLTDLVAGINALTADVSARLVETSDGTYRVVVEGPQGSDNTLTISDSVFGLQTTNLLEVDTYTLDAAVSSGGSASFTYGGTTYTQAFDTDAATTMSGLAAAINAGTAGSTVTAAATSGTVFTMTKDVASDAQMTKGIVGGTVNGSDALVSSTADTTAGSDGNKIQAAQNATLSVNGLSVSSASNQVNGLVPGLELNLLATTSTDVVMSISRDTTVAKQAIIDLVEAYNSFEGVYTSLTAVGSVTEESGSLKSDASIRAIRGRVRDFFTADSSTPGNTKQSLTDVGVSLQRNGSFLVDETALGKALSSDYSDITKMFSGNTNNQSSYSTEGRGIAGDLVNQISSYLAYDGIVKLRESSYAVTKTTLTDEQTVLDTRMLAIETRYTKQFSTMSRIMDQMKSTQEYLEGQLSNLPYNSDDY